MPKWLYPGDDDSQVAGWKRRLRCLRLLLACSSLGGAAPAALSRIRAALAARIREYWSFN